MPTDPPRPRPRDESMEPSKSPIIEKPRNLLDAGDDWGMRVEPERDTLPPRDSLDGGAGGAELDTRQLIRMVTANTVETQALKSSVDTLYEALMAHVLEDTRRTVREHRCSPVVQWAALAMAAAALLFSSWTLSRTLTGPLSIGCASAAEGGVMWTGHASE